MSRLVFVILVIGVAALATVSGCSGCQQTAQKPDSASRERASDWSPSPDSAPVAAGDEPSPLEASQEVSAPPGAPESTADTEPKDKPELRASGEQAASDNAANASGRLPKYSEKTGALGNAPAASAVEVLNSGQAALRDSAKLAAAGDDDAAFQTALAGWEATRRFPNDPQLKRLTAQLLQRLKQSGEAATRKTPLDADKASVLE